MAVARPVFSVSAAALLEILLDREPRPHLGRHVQPRRERPYHRPRRVDDHLGGHDVVGLGGGALVPFNRLI